MNVDEYWTKICKFYETTEELKNDNALLIGDKAELEEIITNLKVEAEQKLKYQNDYNEAIK